jgi:copper transport protein
VRRLALATLALTVAGGAILGGAAAMPSPVLAHALRESSVPGVGASLRRPPASVTITFTEEPDPLLSRIEVLDASGRQFQTGPARTVGGNPRRLVVDLAPLPPGVYTVAWTTVSAIDGHVAEGAFAFGVGVPAAAVRATGARPPPSHRETPAPSPTAVIGRWLLYAGLMLLLGVAFVSSAVLVTPPRSSLLLLPAAWAGAVAGTAAVIAAQASDAGIGPGELLRTALARGAMERVATVTLSGALVLVALRTHGSRQRTAVALVGAGAAGAMLADVAAGHAAAGRLVAASSALQWVHIMAAGIWLGGLAALLPALRGEPGGVRMAAVRRFSASAAIALAALATTGTIRAAAEIGAWSRVTNTAYGRLVVLKVALLGVLVGLGAVNRLRNLPRAACTARGLRRVGSAEVGVGIAALLATATLVNVAPPAPTTVTDPSSAASTLVERRAAARRAGDTPARRDPRTGPSGSGDERLVEGAALRLPHDALQLIHAHLDALAEVVGDHHALPLGGGGLEEQLDTPAVAVAAEPCHRNQARVSAHSDAPTIPGCSTAGVARWPDSSSARRTRRDGEQRNEDGNNCGRTVAGAARGWHRRARRRLGCTHADAEHAALME